MTGRSSRWLAATSLRCACVGALLLGLAGCNDANGIAVHAPATSSPTASPTPSSASEQQAILGQYRKFWSSLTSVSRMPASQRRAALTPFTMDPELKSLLAGMVATDRKDEVFYGAHMPRAEKASLSPDGSRAVIDDCQDSSRTGLARRSDLAPLTKGMIRNHVVVTMRRADNAVWKVYFVSYTKTPC